MTPEEFVSTGHPPMAWNIPFAFLVYQWDTEEKAFPWGLNSDFVSVVQERFGPMTEGRSAASGLGVLEPLAQGLD